MLILEKLISRFEHKN